jgi:seryl-tRNA synthetase
MAESVFQLPHPLGQHGLAFFLGRVPYCSEQIISFEMSSSESGQVLRYNLASSEEPHVVEPVLRAAFEMAVKVDGDLPGRVVFDQPGSREKPASLIDSELSEEFFRLEEGLYVFGPAFSRLLRAMDGWILGTAAAMGAEEYLIPAYTTRRVLDRCNYMRMFPHHLTFASTVARNLKAIEEFTQRQVPLSDEGYLSQSELVASPAACLNFYAILEGRRLTQPVLMTALATCSRYEAARMHDPTRLWNFRVREIVYLGTRDGALAFRSQWLKEIESLLGKLKLPCRIEAATDPFFTNEQSKLATYQRAFDLKYEVLGLMAGRAPLAIASLNYHQQHFGSSFNISGSDEKPVHTACVGFGLDRWAYWLLFHIGRDEAGWSPLKEALEGF